MFPVRNPKIGLKSAVSLLQIIAGCLIVISCGGAYVIAIMGGLIHMQSAVGPLLGFLIGVALVYHGMNTAAQIGVYKKLIALPCKHSGQTIEVLAGKVGLTTKKFLKSLQFLINEKFWNDKSIKDTIITLKGYYTEDLIILANENKAFKQRQKKSYAPLLAVIIFSLVFCMIPFYRWNHVVSAAIIGVIVLIIASKLSRKGKISLKLKRQRGSRFEEQNIPVSEKSEPVQKEAEYGDDLLENARREMVKMRGLKLNASSAAYLEDYVSILNLILDRLNKSPEKIRQSRNFLLHYLPSTVKLLVSYQEMSALQYKGENIDASVSKIENNLPSIRKAFMQELDKLYQDEALDICAEVSVLNYMAQNSGN